ncbi:MAG: PD-(D/E)XK nuclease-like domain-containing protein [Candidatus Contendobacter sp.]|nr:PD-(D/E)XK nuclease-like domain-containing protein [Candidatus Contendobacter sp.]
MNNRDYQNLQGISSHWLIEMLRSPAACWRKYLDPQRPAEEPTDPMRFGTLVHSLALTPRQFTQEFRVIPEDRRSRNGKAEWEWTQAQGWTPIRPAELDRARAVVAALQANPIARKLLRHGKKERTIIQPRASGLLPLKGRLDVHHESKRHVVELKTTWNLAAVETAMERYRYPLSAAFYCDLSKSLGATFVFVQTREPLQVAVMPLTLAQLRAGREQWQTALARFDECWRANDWPEAEPAEEDDDPLMFGPVATQRRFELPVGELAL